MWGLYPPASIPPPSLALTPASSASSSRPSLFPVLNSRNRPAIQLASIGRPSFRSSFPHSILHRPLWKNTGKSVRKIQIRLQYPHDRNESLYREANAL